MPGLEQRAAVSQTENKNIIEKAVDIIAKGELVVGAGLVALGSLTKRPDFTGTGVIVFLFGGAKLLALKALENRKK